MNYKIRRTDINSKYLNIEASFSKVNLTLQTIQLPAWRPGRYEIQDFAKNLRKVTAKGKNGDELFISKSKKDAWDVKTNGNAQITICYEFYADIQNAGGSYVDDNFVYINPINCCIYIEEKQNEECTLEINFEQNKDVACGMPFRKEQTLTTFSASSYHDLVDSPLMISSKIQHKTYVCDEHTFHVWVKGKIEIDWDILLHDFKKFTQEQINIFGEFPEDDYHFLLWMMPNAYYHGVEHKNSTMMTLGPDGQSFEDMYADLLGLASHELFHTWNVKKIRPKELMPYDYSKENYFNTCFVAEGLTTFYGDWILYRSGVLTKNQYKKELETTLKRHFDTSDYADQSLLESSYDLWLDGYQAGIPDRKVSVYHKGAIAALILHDIFQKSNKSLDDLMKLLWLRYGLPYKGYTYEDYQGCCEELYGSELNSYFEVVVAGNQSLLRMTENAIKSFGFSLNVNKNGYFVLTDL
jgi:predicted metalloprotease with PDZ domain